MVDDNSIPWPETISYPDHPFQPCKEDEFCSYIYWEGPNGWRCAWRHEEHPIPEETPIPNVSEGY